MNAVAVGAVTLVALERLGELWLAGRNTRSLLAHGGIEVGQGHYPLIVALHGAWLAALLFLVPADAPVSWMALGLFIGLQPLRFWIIASLGRYWTTRVITVPNVPVIRRGPYRFVRHPNYLVVTAEIALLPLAFGAWQIAAVFSILNAALLAWRIRVEEQMLAARR